MWKEDLEEVEQIVLGYFTSIFTSSNPSGFEAVLNSVQQRVTPAMNAMLMRPVTEVEVRGQFPKCRRRELRARME